MRKLKSVVFCIVFAMLYSGIQFAFGVIIGFVKLFSGADKTMIENTINNHFFIIHILSVVIFIVIVMLYRKITKNKMWDDEKKIKRQNLWISSLTLALSYSMIWSILTINFQFENMKLIQNGIWYYSKISPIFGYLIMTISVMIAAPIGEEFLCRKMMIGILRKNYSVWISVFISSLIFGAIHITAGGFVLAIGAFIMGLILGFIYVCSGDNFVLVATSHIIANCAEYILMAVPHNVYIPLMISLFVICGVCVKYMYTNSTITVI